MSIKTSHTRLFIYLILGLIVLFCTNVLLGSIHISVDEFFRGLYDASSTNHLIIHAVRIPKALSSILIGIGLGLAGFLMQILFRNPLSGPYVLGVTTGGSLGAALFILGSALFSFGFIHPKFGIPLFSSLGSLAVLAMILVVYKRIKDPMTLLITGILFSSISGAAISLLAYFSSAERLREFVFWSYGSTHLMNTYELFLLALSCGLCFVFALRNAKPLEAFLAGDVMAKTLGVDVDKIRFQIIIFTGLTVGVLTAFAGPIAFVGLVVPHISRQILKTSNVQLQLISVSLIGSLFVLASDVVATLPGSALSLPINAVTSIIGAPILLFIVIKTKRFIF
jgi:iron complex transport system permease protein